MQAIRFDTVKNADEQGTVNKWKVSYCRDSGSSITYKQKRYKDTVKIFRRWLEAETGFSIINRELEKD